MIVFYYFPRTSISLPNFLIFRFFWSLRRLCHKLNFFYARNLRQLKDFQFEVFSNPFATCDIKPIALTFSIISP